MDRAWHQGVPIWWYEHVMATYAERFPGICFLLSCTGCGGVQKDLRKKFDVLETPLDSPYPDA